MGESGLPGFEFNSWFALRASAGTPKAIISQLAAEVQKALLDADVRDKIRAQGLMPCGTTPEELATATRAQLVKYGELIRKNGITVD